MQLTSKDGNMVVDFYPVKFATGEIHNRLMLKVVTFMGATQSKSYINKKDFQYEFDSRTHGYGYQVTDESMIPQLFNSAMACACWFMSFVSTFTYSKMNTNLEMLTAREQLMEDIDSIIETFCMEMWEGKYPETQEDLTRILCDAVCKNFPTKWSWPLTTSSTVMNFNKI